MTAITYVAVAGSAAGAQPSAARTRAAETQVLPPVVVTASAPATVGPFALDDALLAGIALSDAQQADIAELRRLQTEDREAARPRVVDAVAAMRRARDRGDAAGADAIMAVLQGETQDRRTWRLIAVRALLTPEQRVLLDANLGALMSDAAGASQSEGRPQ